MDFSFIVALLSIVLIDVVLSGDNALVIGLAAQRLPLKQRRRIILWGTAAAVIVRVLATVGASYVLSIPLLQAVGGGLLVWISLKLAIHRHQEAATAEIGRNFWDAVRIIVVADAVMGIDNMLAVAGASHGHIGLLLFGLALSIPLLMFAATWIAVLVSRFPWLNALGAGVIAWTGAAMVVEDPWISSWWSAGAGWEVFSWLLPLGVGGIMLVVGLWSEVRSQQRQARRADQKEVIAR